MPWNSFLVPFASYDAVIGQEKSFNITWNFLNVRPKTKSDVLGSHGGEYEKHCPTECNTV
jgi:hypothetical protein